MNVAKNIIIGKKKWKLFKQLIPLDRLNLLLRIMEIMTDQVI